MGKSIDRVSREARIALLRERCQELSNERSALEDINEAEDAAPWIGACFKYRNRDSHNDKHWWVYYRVLKHDGGNAFVVLQCQSQAGGWHIVTSTERLYLLPNPEERGLVRITRREFDAQWEAYLARVRTLNVDTSPRRPARARARS